LAKICKQLRGFILGLLLVVLVTFTVLSVRPGGLRRQMRMAARRFRIFLILGGVYLAASLLIRLFFPAGPVSDYGPGAVALVLVAVFAVIGQDPAPTRPGSSGSAGR
jgi:uncharacterized membrane protein